MLELSLTATIPLSRVDQVLGILAGHAASQPVRLQEHHVLFKPKPAAEMPLFVGGSQDVQTRPQRQQQEHREALIVRLTRTIGQDESADFDGEFDSDEEDELENEIGRTYSGDGVRDGGQAGARQRGWNADAESGQENRTEGEDKDGSIQDQKRARQQAWTLMIYDLPQAAPKDITSRSVWVTKGVDGDIAPYLEMLEYSFLHHFLLSGHFLVIKNLVVRVYRVYKLPPASAVSAVLGPDYFVPLHVPLPTADRAGKTAAETTTTTTASSSLSSLHSHPSGSSSTSPALDLDRLQPLDPTGTHMVEVSIKVLDGTRPDQVAKAMKELEEFRKRVQGVLDLVAPDRLAMDTRVRASE